MTKQVLDIMQMQHLQELGMELKETMLYWVVYEVGHENNFVTTKENAMEVIDESCGMLPAYTLQDVLDALPEKITHKQKDYLIEIWERDGEWYIGYLFFDVDDVVHLHDETNKSFIDAAYSLLCWAIENKFVETNKNG
jgi:hypothetical protein